MKDRQRDFTLWIAVPIAFLCIGVIAGRASISTHNFSPYQSTERTEAEYRRCKNAAPKGFDCVMVPMLVSEEYLRNY